MSPSPGPSRPAHQIRAGFIPLLDCAPLIVAGRMGFAAAEGITLTLMRETSWATLRDRVAVRHLDVAHMLAPMPIADNLGLTPLPAGLIAPMALGFGGNTITVSCSLWDELAQAGARADFEPASTAGAFRQVVAARQARHAPRLTLGIVHSHSAHHYELAYWLAWAGVVPGRDFELVVVPPSLSAAALATGQVDGFCAGEPWGSAAVAEGIGRTVTTNAHIWRSSPEKVLGVRRAWADEEPERLQGLIRAVWRAAVWCDEPGNREELAGLLSEEGLLGQPARVLLPGLRRTLLAPDGSPLPVSGFLSFAGSAATFPWISHALWMFTQMARWKQVSFTAERAAIVRQTYRPDLYRTALAPLGVPIPTADVKVEGAMRMATTIASSPPGLTLESDVFFDGTVFDSEIIESYVSAFETGVPPL